MVATEAEGVPMDKLLQGPLNTNLESNLKGYLQTGGESANSGNDAEVWGR